LIMVYNSSVVVGKKNPPGDRKCPARGFFFFLENIIKFVIKEDSVLVCHVN
jgi:hypothetical protein